MSTESIDDSIEKAIKDGLSNYTGEWFNGWICPGLNLSEEQLRDLLLYLTKAKRLKGNIADLIKQSQLDILERVGEIIGEDYPKPSLGDFWNVGRNQLRAEQREALNRIKEEL